MSASNNKVSIVTQIKIALPLSIVALVSLLLDQVTKQIVRNTVAIGGTVEVIRGYFEICYSENTGAAFGIFRGQNMIFVFINLIAIAFIFIYYRQFKNNLWMKVALGFILGGALGNLADRVFFGFVTDFIRVRFWMFRFVWWPNFNIADASVFAGAVMLIIGMFKKSYMDSQISEK